MHETDLHTRLNARAVCLLTILCMVWGFNAVAIKVSNAGMAPIFSAGIRSVIAAVGLTIWMKYRGIPLFPGRVLDGAVAGSLFGIEFGFLFCSLLYTTASSAWILLYTTPFFHAVGAHYFLAGDRLSPWKIAGLVLAFLGIVLLFAKHLGLPSLSVLFGDGLALAAGFWWAATTIYIKRRLVGHVTHYHTLFYQIAFSVPILFILSAFFEEAPIREISAPVLASLGFQGIIVAFVSYLLWFYLVHVYPVSRLSAFTFLTPIFATLSGVLFLDEPLTLKVISALALVSLGIYAVNRG